MCLKVFTNSIRMISKKTTSYPELFSTCQHILFCYIINEKKIQSSCLFQVSPDVFTEGKTGKKNQFDYVKTFRSEKKFFPFLQFCGSTTKFLGPFNHKTLSSLCSLGFIPDF